VERVPEAIEQKATEVTSKLKSAHDEVAQKLAQVDSVLTRKFNEANTSIESMEERVETAAAAAGKVSDLESKLAATDKWAQFDNSRWFQHFNRRLSNEHTHTLETEWRKRLSLPISKQVLGYMASRACDIERRLDGRLATSVEDILLRTLIARAVKGKTLDVLEIGTLFATGAAIMYDSAAPHFDKTHFTLLDPLEGYYNSAQADILTGQVVNEAAVRRNLARVGMSEDEYTLIKNLSTDPEAIGAAGQKSYDVLIIDGDHSYAGVKADFENYAGFVKLGGYIILDDYNSPDWPDVTEYVDKELADHPYVSKVGSTWRTCVYRVVKTPAKQTTHRRKPAAATPRKQAAETENE
jgi:cephalosporin hydroxylase